jgi:hypothetical protein
MFVYRRKRREAEAAADFFQARRVPVLLDEVVQEVQNLALAFGEWQHAPPLYAKEKRKSTDEMIRFTLSLLRQSK